MLRLTATFSTLFCILASIASNIASAEQLLKATYKGRHTGISITLVRTLNQNTEQQFTLQSKASSFVGSITEKSEFIRKNKAIIPLRYDYTRSVLGKKSEQHLHFNWVDMQAQYRREDKPQKNKEFELTIGSLDPSLYQLKLQQELAAGKSVFSFDFAKDSGLKKRDFKVTGPTEFELQGEVFDAVAVERINQPDKKQTKIILVPKLNYQIARITHIEEDGSQYKIELKDYEAKPDKLGAFYASLD